MAWIIAATVLIALLLLWRMARRPWKSEYSVGATGYVFVEDDGSARELSADEVEYLDTDFHPADGARPYIKRNYAARTPEGGMRGYLRRDKLPAGATVGSRPKERNY